MAVDHVLLDLDGTLIEIDQAGFLRAYLADLSLHFADVCPPEKFVAELWRATEAMMQDQDPGLTNREVFVGHFFPRVDADPGELMPRIDEFYRTRFPAFRKYSRPSPHARAVAKACLDMGLGVTIATNPVFPRAAVEERLRWAGVDDLPFSLVTTYEVMHFCKPHPGYFTEIAAELEADPRRCLMVGDDLPLDLVGAARVGMRTFHVAPEPGSDDELAPDGRGDLPAVLGWLNERR